MKTNFDWLSKASMLCMLVGNSQQAATALKNGSPSEFPLWPGSLTLMQATRAVATACGNADTGYFHLRSSGIYAVPQKYAASGAMADIGAGVK